MKIASKLSLGFGFGFLLTMLIPASLMVYVNEVILEKAGQMSQDDVPGAILSLSLLDEVGDMNGNVLEYLTGEAQAEQDFEQDRAQFVLFFKQRSELEQKQDEIESMQQISHAFNDYVSSVKENVFDTYDPKIEAWAINRAEEIQNSYSVELEATLDKAWRQEVADSNMTRDLEEAMNDDIPGLVLYLSLVNKAGDLVTDLNEYVSGETDERETFTADAIEFEHFYNQLKPLEQKPEELEQLKVIYTLFSKVRNGAEQIFVAYDPEKKHQAIAAVEMLEHSVLADLDTMLRALAQQEKQDALASTEEMVNILQNTTFEIMSVIILSVLIGILISFLLARSISQPLTLVAQSTKQLTEGDLSLTGISQEKLEDVLRRSDEVGEIGKTFNQLSLYFKGVIQDIVTTSQGIAAGNLRITPQAEYRGDFDQIKTALLTILTDQQRVTDDIINIAEGLANGKVDTVSRADYRGDFAKIQTALQNTAAKLAESIKANADQNWLKTGQTQIGELLGGEQDFQLLAKNSITFLTTYVKAHVGLFYLLEQNLEHKDTSKQSGKLSLIASYGYTSIDGRPTQFAIGEGLVGQAALEGQMLQLERRLEECTPVVQSGLTDVLPNYVVLIPFSYENTLKGVIEVGTTRPLTEIQQYFLEQAMPNIGIAVNTAEARLQMQMLLEQSQAQAEELQTQQEELRLQNEQLQSQKENLRDTNDTLEERTNELEKQKKDIQYKNKVLQQSQAEMEKTRAALEVKAQELELASRYKSEFLANMSHELRTPLNSLLILAQILSDNKSGNLTTKQIEYAKTIHSAGSDLLTLINEILDLSKVESGKMEVHLEDVGLAEMLDKLENKFRPIAENKAVAFSLTLAAEMPTSIRTDGQRLKQILNNLLSNALKFTEQGEVKLFMRQAIAEDVQNTEMPIAGTLSFSVADTGIGIPQDQQLQIFEAFQQVDGATNRRYEGTGLGLSISRQLAHLLGGELRLTSEVGKGSTFTLLLPEKFEKNRFTSPANVFPTPATEIEETNIATDSAQISAHMSVPATLPYSNDTAPNALSAPEEDNLTEVYKDDRTDIQAGDKILLVIEDDEKFSDILLELAQEKGFKCLLAENGRAGLHLAEDYGPSAIILDIGLPELDGWTLMEIMKSNPNTRHIPIHVISAADYNDIYIKKRGGIGYLRKPVNINELTEAFNSIGEFIEKDIKNILVITDKHTQQHNIQEAISNNLMQMTFADDTSTALQCLADIILDCIVLDIEQAEPFLAALIEQPLPRHFPVIIIYAERELSQAEQLLVAQYANNLPLSSAYSLEKLIDEVTLFLHQVEAKLPEAQRQLLLLGRNREVIFVNKKILLVDDDIRNSFALGTMLENKDMEVLSAKHGSEALQLLDENPDVDIVLMDIMMPEMDGYEAIRRIRAQSRFSKLPIVALTAKAMKGDKAKCIEAGANDYLAKPIDTDKLLSLMRVWLY